MSPDTYLIESDSLGECWLRVSRLILEQGQLSRYDGAAMRELSHLTLVIRNPEPKDALISQYGDPAWLAWMHENFFIEKEVAELGQADSYAVRLFNYTHQGRDQIQWVVKRLQNDPEARSATMTTFVPLTDTGYIPCISLLDFWVPREKLELVVYAHSLGFGKKAYGNLVELAALQAMVAGQLGRAVGQLVIHVKSAHLYAPEWDDMRRVCAANAQ